MPYSLFVLEGKTAFYYNIIREGGNMFTILFEHKLLTGLISFFLLSSIICQIVCGVIYQKMISETANIAATENKLLKQCKQKYANYYKLNGKMVNTDVFVDKFLQKICIAKIQLVKISHISGQFMMLSILAAGVTICLLLAAGDTLFQIIPYYLLSILGLYLYFSISGIVDLQEKRKILKMNLMDYLENYFTPRLETERENAMEEGIRKREKYAKEFAGEFAKIQLQKEAPKENLPEMVEKCPEAVAVSSAGAYQEELEDLLEEFFA